MQPDNGVGDEGAQLPGRFEIVPVDLGEGEFLAAERFEDGVVLLDPRLELGRENLGLEQVDQPQAGPRRLVAVGWADAALGRADFLAPLAQFALLVDPPVVGEDEMGRLADEQAPGQPDAPLFQALDFGDERDRIDDDAVGDDTLFSGPQDAGGG